MEPFMVNGEFSVVVCKSCRFAVVVDEVSTHLKTRHPSVNTAQRTAIVRYLATVPDVIHHQSSISELRYPSPDSEPVPYIAAPRHDGIRCNTCSYVCLRLQTMQHHCRSKHGWVNSWKKGGDVVSRSKQPRELPWTTGVLCQRFFPSRAGNRWFEVGRGGVAAEAIEAQVPVGLARKATPQIQQQLAGVESTGTASSHSQHAGAESIGTGSSVSHFIRLKCEDGEGSRNGHGQRTGSGGMPRSAPSQGRWRGLTDRRMTGATVASAGGDVDKLLVVLERFRGHCVLCWDADGTDHRFEQCPRRRSSKWQTTNKGVQQTTYEMFSKRRFKDFSGCLYCGLPREICPRRDAEGQGDGQHGAKCRYGTTLVQLFSGSMVPCGPERSLRIIESVQDADLPQVDGENRWYEWLGGGISWGGVESSRLCRVAYLLWEAV